MIGPARIVSHRLASTCASLAVTLALSCSPAPAPEPKAAPAVTATAPNADPKPAPALPSSAPAPAASATHVDAGAAQAAGDDQVPDIEYVPTPENVVDKLLEAAKVQKNDVLYDLGCGDGRIVVTAAKRFGIKAVGFDIDPQRVAESRANVKKAKVEHLVTIEQKDIFKVDLSPASVVTLYLLPELNVRLIPQLEKLKPGSRVVSHDFDMEGVEPEKWWTVMAPDHRDTKTNREHYVYLWKVPLKKTPAKPAAPAAAPKK